VFYISKEKKLIGEAKVSNIERLSPNEVWARYKDRLFLNKEEYDMYARISPISKERRKMSEMTAFELKNMRKYKRRIESTYPVTCSGRYLTREMIEQVRGLVRA